MTGQGVLEIVKALFGSIGVLATLGYGWKWATTFFQKQSELRQIDAEARSALQSASAGWKDAAASEKHRRDLEREQFTAQIQSLKSEYDELKGDLAVAKNRAEREALLADFVALHTAENVSRAIDRYGNSKRSRELLISLIEFAGQHSLQAAMKPIIVQAIEMGDDDIGLAVKATFYVWFAHSLVKRLHSQPDANFDDALDAAVAEGMLQTPGADTDPAVKAELERFSAERRNQRSSALR